MSWSKGDEISASKLNSENTGQTNYTSIGNNTSATKTILRYIHKPANSSQVIAKSSFHSLDGWWGHASNHYVKMYASNSSGSAITLLVNRSWTSYQDAITTYIYGSNIPSSGWYLFSIQQNNDWGGEAIDLRVYGYPMSAVSQHEIVAFSSTGSRIHDKELSAVNLNGHYITTL